MHSETTSTTHKKSDSSDRTCGLGNTVTVHSVVEEIKSSILLKTRPLCCCLLVSEWHCGKSCRVAALKGVLARLVGIPRGISAHSVDAVFSRVNNWT